MTTFYLVRHGEPTYEFIEERGFTGLGREYGQLTGNGISQLKQTSKDERLKDCEIIVSSPYTRALQSAAILSKELGIDIEVELDLHEWLPNIVNFDYKTKDDCRRLSEDYRLHKGIYPENETRVWESADNMRKRIKKVINKYLGYKKVIMVCHCMLMEALTGIGKIDYGQIIEYSVDK